MPGRVELRRAHFRVAPLPVRRRLRGNRLRGRGNYFGRMDVLGQLAFRAFGDVERHPGSLLECLESLHRYGGKMREHIRAATIGDTNAVSVA